MSDLPTNLARVYSLLTGNSIEAFSAYCILTPNDEGEIDGRKLGFNKKYWTEWEDEKQLEVILHEFAHIDEGPHHSDHDFAFYTRLQALTNTAFENQSEIEDLLDMSLDFDKVCQYLIDSVNEYTMEDSMSITQTCLYLSHTLPPEDTSE